MNTVLIQPYIVSESLSESSLDKFFKNVHAMHVQHMPLSCHPPRPSRRRAGRHPLEQRVSIAAVRIDSRGAHCAVVQHLAMQRRQGDVYVLVTRVSAARPSGDVLHQVFGRARPSGRDGDEEQHGQQQEWTHQGSRPAWLRAKGSRAVCVVRVGRVTVCLCVRVCVRARA